jgi:hypothetical protein
VRNNLSENDFKNSAVSPKAAQIGKNICRWKYNKKEDWKAIKDFFKPVSDPQEDYHRMPLKGKFEFISND